MSNPGKKNGDLLAGYKTAQHPQAWLDERAQQQRDYDELQRLAAEAVPDEDQLASDDQQGAKRKRDGKKDEKEEKRKKKAKLDKLAKSRVSA